MTRRWLTPGIAVVAIAVSAAPVLALLLWKLTVTPLSAQSGIETTFTLTATNADLVTELGCLEVDLPESFSILHAAAGSASNGDGWEAVVFTGKVAVHSLSGGGRLESGQSITFTIRVVPTVAGTWTWPNHAHPREDCTGPEEVGAPLAITVLPGETILPTPVPTPKPTATPRPTPTPTPIITLPSILPTLPSLPGAPDPTATPRPTPTPAASLPPLTTPSPSPVSANRSPTPAGGASASPGSAGPAGASSDSAGSGRAVLAVARPEEAGDGTPEVSLGPLGVVDGLTVWAIPGAVVGGPGLLVILWVALQAGVAAAWIPAVRRMRGQDVNRPPPRQSAAQ